MGRLLPQKPPRRYPSGFCNLLDTDRDRRFRPAPDLRAETLRPSAVPGDGSLLRTGFHRC